MLFQLAEQLSVVLLMHTLFCAVDLRTEGGHSDRRSDVLSSVSLRVVQCRGKRERCHSSSSFRALRKGAGNAV